MLTKTLAAQGLVLDLDAYALTGEDHTRFAEEQALGMRPPQDPVLLQTAAAVAIEDIGTPRIQSVINRLMTTANSQQRGNQRNKKTRTLVGLAAPQIGEPLRIIVVDTKITVERKKPGVLECFINPEIVWQSRETEEGREGCFSAGPVWGMVRRSVAVKIRAWTPEGKQVERIFEGFTARILLHERDHLDGVRFPERITSDAKRHWVHSEEIANYITHYTHWPRKCSRERWEMFKRGG